MKNWVNPIVWGIIIWCFGPVSFAQGPGNGPFLDVEYDRICLVDSIAPDSLFQFWRYTNANKPGEFVTDMNFDLSNPYTVQGSPVPCCNCLNQYSNQLTPATPVFKDPQPTVKPYLVVAYRIIGFIVAALLTFLVCFAGLFGLNAVVRAVVAIAFLFLASPLLAQDPAGSPSVFLDVEFDRICLVDSISPDTVNQFWRYTMANKPGEFTFDVQFDLSNPYTVQGTVLACEYNRPGFGEGSTTSSSRVPIIRQNAAPGPVDSNYFWLNSNLERLAFVSNNNYVRISPEYQFENLDSLMINSNGVPLIPGISVYVQNLEAEYRVSADTNNYRLDSVYCVPLPKGLFAQQIFDFGIVDVGKGGAALDGITDDTEIVRKAIDQVRLVDGRNSISIWGDCRFDPGIADFRNANNTSQTLNIYFSGSLRPLNNSIRINGATNLIGDRINQGVQFMPEGGSVLWAPYNTTTLQLDTIPSLIVTGSTPNYIANVYANSRSFSGAISIGDPATGQGAAIVTLQNVGINAQDVSGATGIKIFSAFWVFIRNCAFNAVRADLDTEGLQHSAMHVLNDQTVNGTSTVLVQVKETTFSGRPVVISGDPVNGNDGIISVRFSEIDFENYIGANFILDFTNQNFSSNITFSGITDNDRRPAAVDNPKIVIKGQGVRGLTIKEWFGRPIIHGICQDCDISFTDDGFTGSNEYKILAHPRFHTTGTINKNFGDLDARITTRGMITAGGLQIGDIISGFPTTPADYEAFEDDSLTVSPSKFLDNQYDAIRFDPTVTEETVKSVQIYTSNQTFADSQWVFVGAWVRSSTDTLASHRFENKSIFQLSTVATNSYFQNDLLVESINTRIGQLNLGVPGNGWQPVVNAVKVFNPDGATGAFNVRLFYSKDRPFELYKPFVMVLPDTVDLREMDIDHLANSMAFVDEATPKGSYFIPGLSAWVNGLEMPTMDLTFPGFSRFAYWLDENTLADAPISYDAVNNRIGFFINPPYTFGNARVYNRTNAANQYGYYTQYQAGGSSTVFGDFHHAINATALDVTFEWFRGFNQSTNQGFLHGFRRFGGSVSPTNESYLFFQPVGALPLKYNAKEQLFVGSGGVVFNEADTTAIEYGTTSPEGVLARPPGSQFLQSNGLIWHKRTGTGNTGWRTTAFDTFSGTTDGIGQVTVNHNLGYSPIITLTPVNTDYTLVVDSRSTTSFIVEVYSGGVLQSSAAIEFDWIAR